MYWRGVFFTVVKRDNRQRRCKVVGQFFWEANNATNWQTSSLSSCYSVSHNVCKEEHMSTHNTHTVKLLSVIKVELIFRAPPAGEIFIYGGNSPTTGDTTGEMSRWNTDKTTLTIIMPLCPERQFRRRAYVLPQMFFFFFRHAFSEVPRPIAVKLCRMIRNWLNFIMQVQKFRGRSPNKFGAKTCKISVDFIQPSTLIANTPGAAQPFRSRYPKSES